MKLIKILQSTPKYFLRSEKKVDLQKWSKKYNKISNAVPRKQKSLNLIHFKHKVTVTAFFRNGGSTLIKSKIEVLQGFNLSI